jgi:hypothetical protein
MTRARDLADLGGNAATLEKQGLTLINTTSFSGVTSQPINNVFSSTYDNYKIMLWWVGASASGTFSLRYRVDNADNSTANYARQNLGAASTTVFGSRNDSGTSHSFDSIQTNYSYRDIDVFNPFNTELTTSFHKMYYRADQNQTSEILLQGYCFQATTSFTGFSLLSSGANVTGKVQVFGYNK